MRRAQVSTLKKVHFTHEVKKQLELLNETDARFKGNAEGWHIKWVQDYAAKHCPGATRANVRCDIPMLGILLINLKATDSNCTLLLGKPHTSEEQTHGSPNTPLSHSKVPVRMARVNMSTFALPNSTGGTDINPFRCQV